MSTLSPSSASTSSPHPQRAPPPSLFLGPPSRNASNISLQTPAPQPASTRAPPLSSRSARGPDPTSAPPGRTPPQPPQPSRTEGDRTDALWAEMQATLAEVELSAFSSTHVFGAAHSAALEELREAQIALAKAWGRSEVDDEEPLDEIQTKDEKPKESMGKKDGDAVEGESEDESDIVEARRRREANEKYFKKVGEGVVDVVGRLEVVSQAMAKVERESREIWSGSDSVESGSVTT